MSTPAEAPATSAPTPLGMAGFALVRVVVPVWIVLGASVKAYEASPKLLPLNAIITPADSLGINLQWLLWFLVAVEFAAVAVMLLVPRFARLVAGSMLAVFCGVLAYELLKNADSCGCFGSKSPPPAVMLGIDAAMLLGVIFLRPWHERVRGEGPRLALTAVLSVVMAGVSFAMVKPGATVERRDPVNGGGTDTTVEDPAAADWVPDELPQFWVSSDLEQFEGRPWSDFPLLRYMTNRPALTEEGVEFVMFFGRNCETCEKIFNQVLTDPEFGRRTLAIEVPIEKDSMRDEAAAWPMPETEARMDALPLGVTWVVTTPLDIRLEDGVIASITEGHDDSWATEFGPVWDVTLPIPSDDAIGDRGAESPAEAPDSAAPAAAASNVNPEPADLPQFWFEQDLTKWEGRPWQEFDLFTFMSTWPSVPETGTRYVVFYQRTCEHCEEMFQVDLSDPALAALTTAIEVPTDTDELRPANASWPMPVTECELLQLPLGVTWIMTTPLAVRIEDGVITDIEEGDHKATMNLAP